MAVLAAAVRGRKPIIAGRRATAAIETAANRIAPTVNARATNCCLTKLRCSVVSLAIFKPVIREETPALALHIAIPSETNSAMFSVELLLLAKFCNASEPLSVPTEPVGWADTAPPAAAENRSLVLFDQGDEVMVQAGDEGVRFLLVSGKPLEEPVAWYGPIVMNTQEQLQKAYQELQEGTFLKK